MESDGFLQEKAQGAAATGGGRSKLSLRRKKDKDHPAQQSSPPQKPTNFTLRITPCDTLTVTPKRSRTTLNSEGGESDKDLDAGAPDKTAPQCSSNDVEFVPLDEDGEEKAIVGRTELEPSTCSPHQANDGLGDFYFCYICQKDLTQFSESRRQTHINRCCDKQEEERLAAEAAASKEASFPCLICEKSLKSDNARMTHIKSCAKAKGIAPDRLVHLVREFKKTNASVDSTSTSSSNVESGSLSRLEREGKRQEPRRSQRLVGQSGERGKQPSKRLEAALSGGDDDFTLPPPVSRPTGRRGRKRKRDNLQDKYLEELEEDQIKLALAISTSMEADGGAAPVYGGEQLTEAVQGKGKKRQKRKTTTAEVAPPLLTVTTQQAQNIIGQRAEEILGHSEAADGDGALEVDDYEISCTPAFQESELGGFKQHVPPVVNVGTAVDVCSDRDEVILLEEGEEERLELDNETVAKGSDTCLAHRDFSPKSTDEVSNHNKGTGSVHVDTKPGAKAEDGEAMSLGGDESEHSETDTHLATDAAVEHGVSFHEDFQDVDYPTLWQLTSEETENMEHFYVPALVPVVSPIKAKLTPCKVCEMEPCLALSLQAVPTVSPIQPITDSSLVNHESLAVNQLLCDMEGLVGSSLLSDVHIQTQSGSFIPAHAVVLAARCTPLREIIVQSQTTPINLNFSEFDEESIIAFLRFVYTGSSPTDTDDNVELRQMFSLLLERWYSGRSDEEDSFHLDKRSPSLKSVSNSQLKDSSMADAGRPLELASPTSPRFHKLLLESETPQSKERAHTVAELGGKSTVIIERNDNSDSSALGDGKNPINDLKSEAKHMDGINLIDVHHTDFSSRTVEVRPAVEGGGSEHFSDHLSRPGHTSGGSSPELERDCSLRRQSGSEMVRHRSSSESSRPNSHISLSSVDSNEVVICKTPITLLSPQERREGDSSNCDLFHTSLNRYADIECSHRISEDERERETIEGDTIEAETEGAVESIVVESSSSSNSSVDVTPLESPHSIERQREVSPHDSLPGYSIPDYSPVDNYSFGAFDEDMIAYPSVSFEGAPIELAPLELVTPVNDRTVTMVPESIDTVKRKPQDFKTPANCGGVELQTDDDITPMPDFKSMRTPCLKGECARFGVKAMPKKRMIAKLHEIYEHTHPLVDEEGRIISVDSVSFEGGNNAKTTKQRPADKTKSKADRTKKVVSATAAGGSGGESAAQANGVNELKEKVLKYFKSDKQLYQDILLFKSLELSYFCTKLKSAGITVTKEKLADVLDNLCITYTVPRQQRAGKKTQEKIP